MPMGGPSSQSSLLTGERNPAALAVVNADDCTGGPLHLWLSGNEDP